jgi:hypothetical protein
MMDTVKRRDRGHARYGAMGAAKARKAAVGTKVAPKRQRVGRNPNRDSEP